MNYAHPQLRSKRPQFQPTSLHPECGVFCTCVCSVEARGARPHTAPLSALSYKPRRRRCDSALSQALPA
eukprot:1998221-Rhodomonas_salina.2